MKDFFAFDGVSGFELVDIYLNFIDIYVGIPSIKLKEFLDVRSDIIDSSELIFGFSCWHIYIEVANKVLGNALL